jgi:hypothetical protein
LPGLSLSVSVSLFLCLSVFSPVLTCNVQPVLSRIYLYSFISLFIYSVLNIFIAIIEDAFITSTMSLQRNAQEDHDLQHAMGLAHEHTDTPLPGSAIITAHTAQYGTLPTVAPIPIGRDTSDASPVAASAPLLYPSLSTRIMSQRVQQHQQQPSDRDAGSGGTETVVDMPVSHDSEQPAVAAAAAADSGIARPASDTVPEVAGRGSGSVEERLRALMARHAAEIVRCP